LFRRIFSFTYLIPFLSFLFLSATGEWTFSPSPSRPPQISGFSFELAFPVPHFASHFAGFKILFLPLLALSVIPPVVNLFPLPRSCFVPPFSVLFSFLLLGSGLIFFFPLSKVVSPCWCPDFRPPFSTPPSLSPLFLCGPVQHYVVVSREPIFFFFFLTSAPLFPTLQEVFVKQFN